MNPPRDTEPGNEAISPLESPLNDQIYGELRALAGKLLGSAAAPTLQPTALVHEAYLRLAGSEDRCRNLSHFKAQAAVAVRHVLVDYLRHRNRDKRGGGWQRITLQGVIQHDATSEVDCERLHDALTRYQTIDARAARIVELRFFGGLTETEIADLLEVSERTVRNDWSMARSWLRVELDRPVAG